MNEQAIRFRFGIFVLASLILLAVLTILFGGFPSYFKHTETYFVEFGNAQGIAPGTPIRRSGVRIGEVQTVALNNDTGKVLVKIRIDENYTLRKGDRPTIMQGLIGGDASIAFLPPEVPGKEDATPVEPGTLLVGVTPTDAGALVNKASDLVKPAQQVLVEMRDTFQRINKMTPLMEDTLKEFKEVGKLAREFGKMRPLMEETLKDFQAVGKMVREVGPELKKTSTEFAALAKTLREADFRRTSDEIGVAARNWGKVGERVDVLLKTNEDKIVKSVERADEALKRLNDLLGDENQKNVRETLKNFRSSSAQLDNIARDTNDLLKETRVTVKQLSGTLKKTDEAIVDLQKVMKPLGDKGPSILRNVDESTDNLNKTLRDLRELIGVVARSEGTVQKLLTDPALYNNLNDTALMASRIMPRLDRILCDLETFADKLARHPELIGAGGVIRPSSGLKSSPSAPPYHVYPLP